MFMISRRELRQKVKELRGKIETTNTRALALDALARDLLRTLEEPPQKWRRVVRLREPYDKIELEYHGLIRKLFLLDKLRRCRPWFFLILAGLLALTLTAWYILSVFALPGSHSPAEAMNDASRNALIAFNLTPARETEMTAQAEKWAARGTFGDAWGGMNTLISLFGFTCLLFQLRRQAQDGREATKQRMLIENYRLLNENESMLAIYPSLLNLHGINELGDSSAAEVRYVIQSFEAGDLFYQIEGPMCANALAIELTNYRKRLLNSEQVRQILRDILLPGELLIEGPFLTRLRLELEGMLEPQE